MCKLFFPGLLKHGPLFSKKPVYGLMVKRLMHTISDQSPAWIRFSAEPHRMTRLWDWDLCRAWRFDILYSRWPLLALAMTDDFVCFCRSDVLPGSTRFMGWGINIPFQHKNGLYRWQGHGWFSSAMLRMANDTVTSRPRYLFSATTQNGKGWGEAHFMLVRTTGWKLTKHDMSSVWFV